MANPMDNDQLLRLIIGAAAELRADDDAGHPHAAAQAPGEAFDGERMTRILDKAARLLEEGARETTVAGPNKQLLDVIAEASPAVELYVAAQEGPAGFRKRDDVFDEQRIEQILAAAESRLSEEPVPVAPEPVRFDSGGLRAFVNSLARIVLGAIRVPGVRAGANGPASALPEPAGVTDTILAHHDVSLIIAADDARDLPAIEGMLSSDSAGLFDLIASHFEQVYEGSPPPGVSDSVVDAVALTRAADATSGRGVAAETRADRRRPRRERNLPPYSVDVPKNFGYLPRRLRGTTGQLDLTRLDAPGSHLGGNDGSALSKLSQEDEALREVVGKVSPG
jgi:hypothetical protein